MAAIGQRVPDAFKEILDGARRYNAVQVDSVKGRKEGLEDDKGELVIEKSISLEDSNLSEIVASLRDGG